MYFEIMELSGKPEDTVYHVKSVDGKVNRVKCCGERHCTLFGVYNTHGSGQHNAKS
jgi:hypothetical protein